MGKVAFLFPGQGSQAIGMGKAACEHSSAAREVFEAADHALGESLSQLCFEGPEESLRLTANTQPAILTVSIALLRAFGESPDVVAGHSLGEYAANVAAGVLGFEDAVRLVRVRGTYMQEAVPVGEGSMAAVLGGEVADIERVCAQVDGVVEPVNYNCKGQLVIAGSAVAVKAATPRIEEAGGKVRLLPVSAPFHSSLMLPAEERLKPHLDNCAFEDPSVPIYVNVDAEPVLTAEAARDALIRQVSRPVHWHKSVARMAADGVTLCVEIGPGKVLAALNRRIDRSLRCISVQGPGDFEAARTALREARAGD